MKPEKQAAPHPAALIPGAQAYDVLDHIFRAARVLPQPSANLEVIELPGGGSSIGARGGDSAASSGQPFQARSAGNGRWIISPGIVQFWKPYFFPSTTIYVGRGTGWIRIRMRATCSDTAAEYPSSPYPVDVAVSLSSMEFKPIDVAAALVYHELVSGSTYDYFFYLIHFIDGEIDGATYAGNQYEHPVTAPPT